MKHFVYIIRSKKIMFILSVSADSRTQAEHMIEKEYGSFNTLSSHEASSSIELERVGFHDCPFNYR